VSQEEFTVWLRSSYNGPFRVRGYRFEKSDSDHIRIDKALFTREEAFQIYNMLNSKNPFDRVNVLLAILERNGTLLWMLVVTAFLLLALVVIRIRR
jgi:hypothetical protein